MEKRYYLYLLALTVLFIFALGDVSSLLAQEEDTGEFTLEEIVVTAQKREQDQQKVPIAMEVISGESLTALGRDNVDEILQNIANVAINNSADGMRIAIRGIVDDGGVMSDQHLTGSTVAMNIDGSYNSMSNAGQNLFDVERVEVLFGPQSTMYGSNAPGGIVNVITAAPKTDKFSVNASVEYGNYNLLNLQGIVNVPVLKDKVALRLAANKNSQGPYVKGDSDSDTTSARLRALWNVYEKLQFSVTGNWQKRASGGMMGGTVVPFINQDDVDEPWTPAGTTSSIANRDDQITKGISADIEWQTPVGNVAFVPNYTISTAEGWHSRTVRTGPPPPPGQPDNRPTEERRYYQERENTQKGAELRVTNPADFKLFQWIVGGTLYKNKQWSYEDYVDATTSDTGRRTTGNKSALYANITYPLWFYDRLRLTLGYRQSWDENNSGELGRGAGGGWSTEGNPDRYSKPDYKYGFEYDVAANLMLYGSLSTSYRSGAAAGMPDEHGNYPPNEELNSYSAGVKSRWLNNRLQVNLNTYYYDYKNKLNVGFKEALSLTEYDLGGDYMGIYEGARGYSASRVPDGEYPTLDHYDLDNDGITDEPVEFDLHDRNAQGYGDFTSLGLDLQASWLITRNDRLNLSIAYLNAEWATLHFHYEWYMYWPDEDYKGLTPTNSPTWSIAGNYEHNFMLGSLGVLTPRIDMQYKSDYYAIWNAADRDPEGYGNQEPYILWDASTEFQHSSGRWALNAYVKNITNYAVKRSYRIGMNSEMRIGNPRTYGAVFSVKF